MQGYSWVQRAGLLACAGLWLAGCGGGSGGKPPALAVAPEGVVFTYPVNGQSDVPLETRFYVTFSKAVSASAVAAPCTVSAGVVSGHFCLLGPGDAVVPLTPGVNGKIVQFETSGLQQGARYRLFVRSAVIGGGESNLPADLSTSNPLLSFTTSQMDAIQGAVPVVRAINGEAPDVFSSVLATRPEPRYPFMDFATIRVEFSEPLDEKTVVDGAGFQFVEVDGAVEIPVPGSLMVRKQHVSFDPHDDLKPGVTYRLKLDSRIKDLNGEAVAAVNYELVPKEANMAGTVMTQHFTTTLAYGQGGFPARSALTGQPVNAIDLHSPLIGDNDINLLPSTLQAELADPGNFEGTIPFVIRKGNSLAITGLDLQLGGSVPANLQTGTIKATFLNDATGFMGRNPYQSSHLLPDDEKSPVFVYLLFDLALTGTDDKGNAVLNQTIPHVQATGTAKVVNGNLEIETVRTLTMDLLGLDLAPAHMVLGIKSDVNARVESDLQAPRLTSAYPVDSGVDFPVRDGISLIFSKPIDNADVAAGNQISLVDTSSSNAPVPFQFAFDGSTILLKPETALVFGHNYQITLGALADVNGNALVLDSSDPTGGDGKIDFRAENPSNTGAVGPMITSIHAGAPCALTGSTYASPGHCVGGGDGDTNYLPFDMPADGYLDVQFNQAMNVSTLTLGTSCNSGNVRVERVDGSCSVVPGSLIVDTRSIRFKPNQPWVEGADYRLTLVSGTNATCEAGDICGASGRPLNPDPLNGAQAGTAGGTSSGTVIRFRGKSANEGTAVYLPLKLEPFTDMNGNGFRDGGEVARLENSAGVRIKDVDGSFITSAKMDDGTDASTIYLSGTLPVTIGLPEARTVDGTHWGIVNAGNSQIPVRINPGVLYGTSMRMDTKARVVIEISINDVDTGLNVLRLRETGGEPIKGYIVQEEGAVEPQFIAEMDLYMDAPDMNIVALGVFTATPDLKSKPLHVIVKGPITFMEDGRIAIALANVHAVDLRVNISALGNNGYINLQIPADAMKLRLVGSPLKGRR